MNDIFISYSKNKNWVSMLVKALEADGYKVWWDHGELVVGDDYTKEIEEALKNSKCVITVWSQEAIKSPWVTDETKRAYELKKLLPVRSESVNPPLPYGSIQTANLKGWNGNRHNLEYYQLLKGIEKYSKPSYPLSSANITPIDHYYINNNDDTVFDIKTNLTWKRYSEGQDRKPHKNQMIRKYTWSEANKRFNHFSFADYNDWRLPTIKELRTLVYCSNGTKRGIASTEGCDALYETNGHCFKPTINQTVFPNTLPDMYWTSSPYYDVQNSSWILCFNEGYDEEKHRAFQACIRLVRRTNPAN